MSTYSVVSIERLPSHVSVELEPLSDRDMFDFLPGQYAGISFKDTEGKTPVRCFSLTSSPNHPERISFAFRVTGDFTRRFSKIEVGSRVELQGPFGDFVLNTDVKNAVLIAGGIGITPFMSMLRHAVEQRPGGSITLLYACKNPEDFPFMREIQGIVSRTNNIRAFFFTNEIPEGAGDQFVKGPITVRHLKQLTRDSLENFVYYICGPQSMMNGISHSLVDEGVSPFQVVTESFSSQNKQTGGFGMTSKQKTYAWSAAAFVTAVMAIAVLDIYHILPNDDQATAQTQTTSQQAVQSDTTTTQPVTTQDTTQSSTSTPVSTPSTSTNTSSNTNYYYYRPPRSQVS